MYRYKWEEWGERRNTINYFDIFSCFRVCVCVCRCKYLQRQDCFTINHNLFHFFFVFANLLCCVAFLRSLFFHFLFDIDIHDIILWIECDANEYRMWEYFISYGRWSWSYNDWVHEKQMKNQTKAKKKKQINYDSLHIVTMWFAEVNVNMTYKNATKRTRNFFLCMCVCQYRFFVDIV